MLVFTRGFCVITRAREKTVKNLLDFSSLMLYSSTPGASPWTGMRTTRTMLFALPSFLTKNNWKGGKEIKLSYIKCASEHYLRSLTKKFFISSTCFWMVLVLFLLVKLYITKNNISRDILSRKNSELPRNQQNFYALPMSYLSPRQTLSPVEQYKAALPICQVILLM